MTIFQGRSYIRMDPKGRIHLPIQFRTAFAKSNSLMMTNSVVRGQCHLVIYTVAEWGRIESDTKRWPEFRNEVQDFLRFFVSSGEILEVDSQSRILIPQHFRDYARLNEEVVLVGMQNHLELWSAAEWKKLFGELVNQFDNTRSVIAELKSSPTKRQK